MSSAPSLGSRLAEVNESATLKLNALAQSLKKQGRNIINLSAGEPDFAVPEQGKTAAIESIRQDESKYTPAAGMPELRESVARRTSLQQPGLQKPWSPSEVIVTHGAKQSLFNALMVLLNPGDEVLVPAPFWLSYPDMTRIAGGVPKVIRTRYEDGFKVTPQALRAAITDQTRAIILNSPSNPTGSIYTAQEFQALGKVLDESPRNKSIWVISDEIYDRIILDKTPFVSFLSAVPAFRDRCITVNGMSKSAAMTGWRIGWTVAREDFVKEALKLQGQSTSGVAAPLQRASVAALALPEEAFAHQVEAFKKRRALLLESFAREARIKVCDPQGAFYAFLGVQEFLGRGEDSVTIAEKLLQDAEVVVIPGTVFGEPGFVRLSFATDDRTLEEGCRRMLRFFANY